MENKIWTLLARQLTGEATPGELAELQQLLARDPIMARVAQEMKETWHDTSNHEMHKALSSFSKIDAQIQGKTEKPAVEDSGVPAIPVYSRFRKLRIALTTAASVVLLVGSWFLYRNIFKHGGTDGDSTARHEISTMPKTIREINLPDGSVIQLNEGSKIAYTDKFNNRLREIWLTGEAFFDVAKNKEKPFIIHAGKVNVKVLGTAFNVRSYADEQNVETSLIRGSVEVTINGEPSKRYILSPNQKLIVPVKNNDSIQSPAPARESAAAKYSFLSPVKDFYSKDTVIAELSWMEGKLAFSKTPFKNLAARLEKRFNVSFVFEDKEKEDLEFTGVFYKQTLPQALQRLSIAAPFRYRIKDSTVYILKSN